MIHHCDRLSTLGIQILQRRLVHRIPDASQLKPQNGIERIVSVQTVIDRLSIQPNLCLTCWSKSRLVVRPNFEELEVDQNENYGNDARDDKDKTLPICKGIRF